jgi:hypothetical protein
LATVLKKRDLPVPLTTEAIMSQIPAKSSYIIINDLKSGKKAGYIQYKCKAEWKQGWSGTPAKYK